MIVLIPLQISELCEEFNRLDSRLSEINKACRDLKESMGYKNISDRNKVVKEQLYLWLTTHETKEVLGIKLSKVKPAAVKTEERQGRVASRVELVLDQRLSPEVSSEVTPVVLDAVFTRKST